MSATQELGEVVESLTPERQAQLLDYARYLAGLDDRDVWLEYGLNRLAEAYGDDEPEYTLADCIRTR